LPPETEFDLDEPAPPVAANLGFGSDVAYDEKKSGEFSHVERA
jgi:hypothetical protein